MLRLKTIEVFEFNFVR